MSTDTAQSLAEQIDALKAAARECGPLPDEPFIQMAFLSLPVIPALKLTSQGLFDGEKFAFTTLEVTEYKSPASCRAKVTSYVYATVNC